MILHPIDSKLFFSRNDKSDPRLGEWASPYSGPILNSTESEPDLVIWGYPDHEGIQLNGGRLGADQAPSAIRSFFYKMTPPQKASLHFLDLGDIGIKSPLAERHQWGQSLSKFFSKNKTFWMSLGGGHDYGYADGSGFIQACIENNQRPLIINFDAHMDVRPTSKGLNSGTPFYRLLTEFPGKFDFFEVGIQPQCNSLDHIDFAKKSGAQIYPLNLVRGQSLYAQLSQALLPYKPQPLWISLDIDVFSQNEAPGCSQSWVDGLEAKYFLSFLEWLKRKFKLYGLSIYEVSPPLDVDNRTSKLAAKIMFHTIFSQL